MHSRVSTPHFGLSGFARGTGTFQDLMLVNKAVLDLAGIDVPMITLARNPQEQRETIFRQGIVLLAAFIFAPLHGYYIMKWLAKSHKLPDRRLMALSFNALKSPEAFKTALAGLEKTIQTEQARPLTGWFSRNIRRLFYGTTPLQLSTTLDSQANKLMNGLLLAKTSLLRWDVMTEALIFANLGLIKNAFSRWLTGTRFFTGEMNIVSNEKLKRLYEQQPPLTRVLDRARKVLPTVMAVVFPLTLSAGIRHAMANPQKTGWLLSQLRNKAHWFDYKHGFLLSLMSFFMIGLLNDVCECMTSRSWNEARESAIKKFPLEFTFFLGDLAVIQVVKTLMKDRLGFQLKRSVSETLASAPEHLQAKAGRWSAGLFWSSFAMNTLFLTSLIVLNNRWTTQNVKQAADKLSDAEKPKPVPVVHRSPWPASSLLSTRFDPEQAFGMFMQRVGSYS